VALVGAKECCNAARVVIHVVVQALLPSIFGLLNFFFEMEVKLQASASCTQPYLFILLKIA
jgi:hypothetical protein